jgi:hypothetical protein
MQKNKYKASVRVMNRYDYNHFEATLSSDDELSLNEINLMRKNAQLLVNEGIRQYKKAKESENNIMRTQWDYNNLAQKVKAIKENFPQSEWTPEQKATIKQLSDMEHERTIFDYYYDNEDMLFSEAQ